MNGRPAPESAPVAGVAVPVPTPARSPWAWAAYVEVGDGWVVVPSDVAYPKRWADETADRLHHADGADSLAQRQAEPAGEGRAGTVLAEVLAELAATASDVRPILTALYQEAGTPLVGLVMRPAPVAKEIDTPDALVAAWGPYPQALGEPDVRQVELADCPAVRRLDRLPAPPDPDAPHRQRPSPAPVRELLTHVVLVEPGEALVIDAEWYHLGVGDYLEQLVDALAATLRIDSTSEPHGTPT